MHTEPNNIFTLPLVCAHLYANIKQNNFTILILTYIILHWHTSATGN